MYAKGNYVSGSKDPYALRRQTLGIIRILIEKKKHLDIRNLIEKDMPIYEKYLTTNKKDFEDKVLEFITLRVKTVLKEYGFSYDEIEAGITSHVADIYDAYLRLTAIHEARKTPDFTNLAIAFKRVKNIIKGLKAAELDESLLQIAAEKDLFKTYKDNQKKFMTALGAMDYAGCVTILTSFKPAVDKFFDDVMVMDKDTKLKNNRVSLLSHIDGMFMNFIDFEKIVVE
jgi:glycyl-tRNA synthetase beta subunit